MSFNERETLRAQVAADPDDKTARGVFADWLDDHGEHDYARQVRQPAIPKEIEGYDWEAAFEFAGRPPDDERHTCGNAPADAHPEPARPGDEVSTLPFGRRDVKRVVACQDGEKDSSDWVCVGELWDGRFFALRAGCDYTGWD